jgi:NADH-quinone oxidoreductase subunit C
MDIKELIVEKVKNLSDDCLEDSYTFRGDFAIVVNASRILEVAKLLAEDPELQFTTCSDVTAIDWATRKNRFTVVYHIFSYKHNFRLRIRANISSKEPEIDSVTSIWRSANWYERETYDMYGITFKNHPDMRRMYMPEYFEYYPLRKDFPVMGIPGSIPLPHKPESEK